MGTQVVRHTSRGVDITLNFASTENNLSWSFTQEGDGEIYDVSFTNIASYTIGGGAVTLPYAVTNGSSYLVSIVKTTTGQPASIMLKTRRSENKAISYNASDILSDDIQGTKSYFLHPGDNKITIVDSSKISTWVSDYTFTDNPKTVISLPVQSPVGIWERLVWDKQNNRIIVVGRRTSAGNQNFIDICLIDIYSNTITNLSGDINSYSIISFSASYQFTSSLFVIPNYNDNYFIFQSFYYSFRAYFTNLLSWNLDSGNLSLTFSSEYVSRKPSFNYINNLYTTTTNFEGTTLYTGYKTRVGNFYTGQEFVGCALDNITGNVIKGYNSSNRAYIFNNMVQVASMSIVYGYVPKLLISMSAKRRMLITKMSTYGTPNHALQANVINLDTLTNVRSGELFNEVGVTGVTDADALNSIGLWAVLSSGTPGSIYGMRTVAFVNSLDTGSFVTAKLLLDYDCNYMLSNTLRY